MALIQCDFYSEVLGMSSSMSVILPQVTRTQIGLAGKSGGTSHPTLYLLHGLSDDHTIWMRRTSIERYVAPLGIAVVMPAVHRSFYTDMKFGYKYWTFISEELPSLARSFFPLSNKREENFVAGLSMGGYGAFKLGLRYPDRFAAAGSFSGVLDLASHVSKDDCLPRKDFELIFGEKQSIDGTQDDLLHVLEQAASSGAKLPKLYQACGVSDFLYGDNIRFRDKAQKLGIDLLYEELEGTHEWGFWDMQIRKFLKWLPRKN